MNQIEPNKTQSPLYYSAKLDYGQLWSTFSFTGQEGNIRI
jgi:hypothetical protein